MPQDNNTRLRSHLIGFGAAIAIVVGAGAFLNWRHEVINRVPSLKVQRVSVTGRSEIAETLGTGSLPTTRVDTNGGSFVIQGLWIAGSRADLVTRRNGRRALCIEGGDYCYPFAKNQS